MKIFKPLLFALPLLLTAAACDLNLFGSSPASGGIIKSVDGGGSWEISNKLASKGDLSAVNATQIRIDPANPDILYISSTNGGVHQSTDKAKTWKNVLLNVKAYDVQISQSDSDIVFAGGSIKDVAKAFKSTDKGQTWVEVYSEAKTPTYVSAIGLPTRSTQIVFLGLSTGEIIISTNAGTSWNKTSKLDDRIVGFDFGSADGSVMFALSKSGGLYKSSDTSKSWQSLSRAVGSSNYQGFSFSASSLSTIYVATDKGLFRTTDSGNTWNNLSLPLHDANTVVTAILVSQKNSSQIYSAVGQTFYKSNDQGSTWQTKALPTASFVRGLAINPNEQNILYAALGQLQK